MTIGCIGMGNMAQALVQGWLDCSALTAGEVFAYAPNQDKLLKNLPNIIMKSAINFW